MFAVGANPNKRRLTMSSRFDRWSYADMPEGAELARIQRGLFETMGAIVADRYNPINSLPRSETVTVEGAPKVTTAGWVEPRPITSPPGQDAIERLVNAALPHPNMEQIRAQIKGLTPGQREQLLRQIEASNDPRAAELKALVEAVVPTGGGQSG
jgi:hypothetical protein